MCLGSLCRRRRSQRTNPIKRNDSTGKWPTITWSDEQKKRKKSCIVGRTNERKKKRKEKKNKMRGQKHIIHDYYSYVFLCDISFIQIIICPVSGHMNMFTPIKFIPYWMARWIFLMSIYSIVLCGKMEEKLENQYAEAHPKQRSYRIEWNRNHDRSTSKEIAKWKLCSW